MIKHNGVICKGLVVRSPLYWPFTGEFRKEYLLILIIEMQQFYLSTLVSSSKLIAQGLYIGIVSHL